MILYRVSNHTDLSGKGAELAEARWHTRGPGKRLVYLADHPALSVLEMLAHTDREADLPDTFNLLSVEVPENLVETLDVSTLPGHWPDNVGSTQHIGDTWLKGGRGVVLLVPSALVPIAHNCLLNPHAPGSAELRLTNHGRFPLDPRMLPRQ